MLIHVQPYQRSSSLLIIILNLSRPLIEVSITQAHKSLHLLPTLLVASTQAPESISLLTMSRWPLAAAFITAVRPCFRIEGRNHIMQTIKPIIHSHESSDKPRMRTSPLLLKLNSSDALSTWSLNVYTIIIPREFG